MMKLSLAMALTLVVFTGCSEPKEEAELLTEQNIKAACLVKKATGLIVCLDYSQDSFDSQKACAEEPDYFRDRSATGSEYLQTDASHPQVNCRLENEGGRGKPTMTRLGTCIVTQANIRYYSNEWGIDAAIDNCEKGRKGKWTYK